MQNSSFIMNKAVDWSLLSYSFNIPVSLQTLFYKIYGAELLKGDQKKIKVIRNGEEFEAKLINQNFDENKFEGHTDLLQIRYNQNSPIRKKLCQIYSGSYSFISKAKKQQTNKRKPIIVPENIREYIYLYYSVINKAFTIECLAASEKIPELYNVISEEIFEYSNLNKLFDTDATIIQKEKLVKIRKLDISIAKSLKELYGFRCQVTGDLIGEEYGDSVVEAHHIDHFVNSYNNDASNIIIINPTFHRIIHRNNPRFNRKTLSFEFENGVKEKIILNKHLS